MDIEYPSLSLSASFVAFFELPLASVSPVVEFASEGDHGLIAEVLSVILHLTPRRSTLISARRV